MISTMLVLSIAGTFAVGVSGGLAGTRRHLDLFGVVVIAAVVAMAGGIIRDLLIGVPPQGFRDWRYIVAAGSAGVVCCAFEQPLARRTSLLGVFDALGLSLFCVTGTSTALDNGVPPFQAAILGMITGIGGGVLRDVLLGDTPARVLHSGLYAVPAFIGAAVVAVGHQLGHERAPVAIVGALACFAIWLVGDRFDVELKVPSTKQRP